jgi:glycine cleavage system H protein
MVDFDIPDDLLFTEEHEWLRLDGDEAPVGITDYAQDALTDVVYVELPDEGDAYDAGDAIGVIESVKSVSDIYTPVAGTVSAVNDELLDRPELMNEDPYGEGWFAALEVDDPDEAKDLLSPADYEKFLEGEV